MLTIYTGSSSLHNRSFELLSFLFGPAYYLPEKFGFYFFLNILFCFACYYPCASIQFPILGLKNLELLVGICLAWSYIPPALVLLLTAGVLKLITYCSTKIDLYANEQKAYLKICFCNLASL